MTEKRSLTSDFAQSRPALSKFAHDYMDAADSYAHGAFQRERRAQYNDETAILTGNLDIEDVSRTVSIPKSILNAQEEKRKREREAAVNQLVMNDILNDMRNRLAELDAALEERHERLQDKYGEHVIGALAETYLSEQELSASKTDKDRMHALADKFLDENGKVKDQYKGLDEAFYIQDWNEAEALRPIVEKYNDRDYLTDAEAKEVLEAAAKADLTENTNKIVSSMNNEYQDSVDQAVDNNRLGNSDFKSSQGFNFG